MKLFVAFILLIIIPVILLFTFSNYKAMVNSEKEIGKSCTDSLKSIDESIQQFHNTLQKDCVHLSINDALIGINQCSSRMQNITSEQRLLLSKTQKVILQMLYSDINYYSVYLYLDNYDYIITTNADLIPEASFKDNSWLQYYKSYKKDHTPISFTAASQMKSNYEDNSSNPLYLVRFIYPLTHYTTQLDGAIVVNIKESVLSDMINNNTGIVGRSIMIIDNTGNVVSSVDKNQLCRNLKDDPTISDILKSSQRQGYYFSNLNGIDSIVAYYKSSNNWIYIGTTPLSSIQQKPIDVSSLLLSVLIILGGICVAFIVTRRIYNPVNAMMNTIRSRNLVTSKDNEDELSVIFRALDSLSRNSDQEKNRKKMLQSLTVQVLLDNPVNSEMLDVLSERLRNGPLVCIIISVNLHCSAAGSENIKRDTIEELLQEVTEEIIREHFDCFACSVQKGEIVVICNTDPLDGKDRKNSRHTLHSCLEAIQAQIPKIIDTPVSIGIGEPCADFTEIRNSYIKAQIALKQKLKVGFGNIIEWDDKYTISNYYYPIDYEEKIRNCLDLGMKDELVALVEELTETLKTRENLSCENIDHIITQLIGNTIVKYVIEYSINVDDVFGMNSDIYAEIAKKETLDDIKKVLLEKYTKLIDYRNTARDRKNTVEKIKEFIHKNYRRDIGINDIAEYMGLSYSYVRKLFKDDSGTNIVDYINSLRIKEAKKLLMNRSVCIREIAASIGYNNVQSFERYFKKSVGVTPGEFRLRALSNSSDSEE